MTTAANKKSAAQRLYMHFAGIFRSGTRCLWIVLLGALIATTSVSAHAALELRDYPVKGSAENRAASLTVTHFQLTSHLGSRFPRAGQVYLVLSVEWRSKLPPMQGQNTVQISRASDHLFLLLNGERRALPDDESKRELSESKDPTPLEL